MYFKQQILPLIGSNNGKSNKKIYYYQIFFNIFYFLIKTSPFSVKTSKIYSS